MITETQKTVYTNGDGLEFSTREAAEAAENHRDAYLILERHATYGKVSCADSELVDDLVRWKASK